MAGAWILAAATVLAAQVAGELVGWRSGILGEAQILLAGVGALCATLAVAVLEWTRR